MNKKFNQRVYDILVEKEDPKKLLAAKLKALEALGVVYSPDNSYKKISGKAQGT